MAGIALDARNNGSSHPDLRLAMTLAFLFRFLGAAVVAATSALPVRASTFADVPPPLDLHLRPRPDGALPVVAVVGQGKVVLSDFVVPYGVLAQSGAAKVVAVNIAEGPLKAGDVTVLPDMTAADFDGAYPQGADIVIVPATVDKHDAELAWLRAQRAHGAALVSICDGVTLLAEMGALDGRRATGHWASRPARLEHFPKVTWLENTRYVADGDVASSAGVSASLPISLALVQDIAGAQVAADTATRLGVAGWSARHDSQVFHVSLADKRVHVFNMALKHNQVVALRVGDGDDEVALALHAEAWSRTMRNEVRIVADGSAPVTLRGGLRVQPDAVAGSKKPDIAITLAQEAPAGSALGSDLAAIAHRYDTGTARLAALGMEYPWGDLAPTRQAAP
jgi:putative intracellular protease/amidase